MKKRCKPISFALILSLLLTMVPLQVFAADTKKELTIVATSEEEAKKQAEKTFEEKIKENGKRYKLSKIQYELIETKYEKSIEKTMDLKEKPKKTIKQDGVEYTLKSFEQVEQNKDGIEEQIVTAYEDFDYAISAQDVAPTKTVTEINQATGKEEQVECQFTNITNAGTTTVDKTMTITFTNYDSAYFEWNGELIPRNEDVPPLAGHEASLLASVGASNGSIVTGFWWSGEPYTSDGVLCRDAATTVRQPVPIYRANYQGAMTIPKETVYQSIYETPDTTSKRIVTVKASAIYEEDWIAPILVATGIGLVVLAALIIIILMILGKKKEEKSEEKNNG